MTRQELLIKIKQIRKEFGITIENLAYVSELGIKTITRLFAGNVLIDINTLREKRAEKKALEIISLVQDTSVLENQGLEKQNSSF